MIADAILLGSLAFRASLNTLQHFSPADETSYLRHSTHAAQPGYWKKIPEYTEDFLANRPGCTHPFRYAWYLFCARVCRGEVTFRKLAWISTIAGAVAPLLAYRLGGWPAALLTMVSPLSLGLGRRALQDTTIGSLTALAFYAALTGNAWFLGLVLTALLFVKEVNALGFVGIATTYALAGGHNPWPFVVPVVLFGATSWGFMGLDVAKLKALYVRLTQHDHDAYAMGYGRGPMHTYVLEWVLFSPIVAVLLVRSWSWSPLATGWLVYVASWSVLRFKNFRYFTGADIVGRALAASWCVGKPWWVGGFVVAASGVWDLWMFRRLFLERGVYDPVVHTVEKALDMVP